MNPSRSGVDVQSFSRGGEVDRPADGFSFQVAASLGIDSARNGLQGLFDPGAHVPDIDDSGDVVRSMEEGTFTSKDTEPKGDLGMFR